MYIEDLTEILYCAVEEMLDFVENVQEKENVDISNFEPIITFTKDDSDQFIDIQLKILYDLRRPKN